MGTEASFVTRGAPEDSPAVSEEAVRIRSSNRGVVGALVVVLVSLSVGPFLTSGTADGQTGSTLRVGFLANIESLNPFLGINDADYFFYALIYDYLFSLDQDGNPASNIAVSGAPDAAGMNWTYEIRSGVKWHDGSNLTARDVAFSVNYAVSSGFALWAYEPYLNRVVVCTTNPYRRSVEGGPDCGANITDWDSAQPSQVTIFFGLPFVPGKSLYFPIVQWKQWCDNVRVDMCVVSPDDAQGTSNTPFENLNPIGTGPFMADAALGTAWRNGDPLLVHRNPNYHNYVAHIDDMFLISGISDVSLVSAIQAGEIDVAEVTPAGYDALAGSAGVGRQEYLVSTQYWIELGFQQVNDPLANGQLNPARWDQNVRRALAMATNKDAIIQTDFLGKAQRGSTLISPIVPFWHYDPATEPSVNLTYNVAAARALLDTAGYTGQCAGKPGVRAAAQDITVDANGLTDIVPAGQCLSFVLGVRQEYPQEQAAAADIVTMWAQVGVDVTNIQGTSGTYSVMLESALEDAVYASWSIDTYIWYWSGDPDPNYLLSIESGYTLDGWNDNYWDNATYNALYIDHLAAFVPTERQAIVREAQKVHYESAVYIILAYPIGTWAYREDKFEGWGDWSAHPYRQINAFYTAPPLFRDLTPKTSAAPVSGLDYRFVAVGAVVAVVAIAALAMWMWRKGRKEREGPTLPPPPPPK